jgi:hypothetical protein
MLRLRIYNSPFKGGGGVDVISWGSAFWYSTLCRPPRSADLSNQRQSRPYHGRPPQKMLGSSRLLGISITRCCVRANKATRLLRICSTSAPGRACVVAGFERPRALHLHSRPTAADCAIDIEQVLVRLRPRFSCSPRSSWGLCQWQHVMLSLTSGRARWPLANQNRE